MHSLDVDATLVCEEHQVVVRAGGEEMLDEIIRIALSLSLAGGHADNAFAAPTLCAVGADVGAFDQPGMGDRDDHTFVGNQVLDVDLALVGYDIGEAVIGVLEADFLELGLDDGHDTGVV